MITYETYCQIRRLHGQEGLGFNQIGRLPGIDPETAARYARMKSFPRRRSVRRGGKLEPFKPLITAWLEHHPYTATQSSGACAGRPATPAATASSRITCGPCAQGAIRPT